MHTTPNGVSFQVNDAGEPYNIKKKNGKFYNISGHKVEGIESVRGEYRLVAVYNFGKELIVELGDDRDEVRAQHKTIARNEKVVSSIELRDREGNVETLWHPFADIDYGYGKEIPQKTFYHVTPIGNLDTIKEEGLKVQVGPRSEELGEKPGVWLFTSYEAMDDGLGNWLGEALEDEPGVAILEVKIPFWMATTTPNAEFEACCTFDIPADNLRLHSIDMDEEFENTGPVTPGI